MRQYHNVPQAPCSNCGERNFRIGKSFITATRIRELRTIRFWGYFCCLSALGLAALDMFFDTVGALTIAALAMVGLSVVLFSGELCYNLLPLHRAKIHHYKCLNCGFSWDS